jgi:myo-inositol-1(or 4)-monophosphatase
MPETDGMKDFAVRLTEKAGEHLLENFGKDPGLISRRGIAKEITTRYDKEVDKLLIKEISGEYPDHNILTEESGFIGKGSEYTWIVDSLDGSSNFAVGNPFFSVSVALMKNKELVFGVINAPFLKELFVAEKGRGAFLNGKRIHVSDTTEFGKSYFLSCEGGEKTNRRIAEINSMLHSRLKDLRKLGSGALEGAWVACGRAEAYVTTNIFHWDVASAVLLVKEAGGKVTDLEGRDWEARQSDVIFSNGKIHDRIVELIKSGIKT